MSVQGAHAFIVRLRERPETIEVTDPTVAGVIDAGWAAGFSFDEGDLRAAHAHDWVLRWLALRSQTDSAGAAREADNLAANPRAKAR